MTPKGGLGKGLDALIPGGMLPPRTPADTYVPVTLIKPNPRQPRETMPQENLAELAASIAEHGIIQPLIVSHDSVTGMYTLIAGERRLRAAIMAGLEKVPVIIRTVNEQQRLVEALIENIQRADLSPLESARGFQHLVDEFNLSHEEIAAQVGKSRTSVSNTLRLLKLPPSIQAALAAEKISEGHARALLGLPTDQAMISALNTVLNLDLTVRQTEELVRKLNGEKPPAIPGKVVDPEVVELENRLREKLGTRVSFRPGRKGGTITIHYYSEEELNSLINTLLE